MGIGPAYGDGYTGVDNSTLNRTVYVKGNEFIDGSVRFTLDAATERIIRTEERIAGVWVLSRLETVLATNSVATWVVDDVLGEFVLDEFGIPVEEG